MIRKSVLALAAVVALFASASDAKAFFFHRNFFRQNVVVVNNFRAGAVGTRAAGVPVGGRFARVGVGPRFVRGGFQAGFGFRGGFAFGARGGFARR